MGLNIFIKRSYPFGLVFIYCEFGQQIGLCYRRVDDAIYQMDWFSFPIEVQRRVPMILMLTQKPVEFKGFGDIVFTRDTFKRVIWSLKLYNFKFKPILSLTLYFQIVSSGFSAFTVLHRFQ